ncbi:hypothetical protein [Gordonia crocea]|uniref:SWIM-type domain-containing protein n=1 Tax=Gordonia crocea TaxID=589162 RepID=A0A7M4BQ34_9ACTN|nr:hypothetical protein [Gordonia crocea]GED95995.1 hypothetical protein nbrc107697_00340 [Gordonia crocea]
MSNRAAIAARCARFDDEAWAARASAGLVRRARKDLAAAVPVVVADDAELVVAVAGAHVRFDEAGPETARCDCPAVGVCRHLIAACLWLGTGVQPAPEAVPAADDDTGPTRAELARHEARAQMRTAVAALLSEIVAVGIAHASAATVERCSAAAISAQVAEHYRLAAALRRIADHLRRIVARTAGAGEAHVAADLASTLALIGALDAVPVGTPPPVDLIGLGRTGYEKIARLSLVGLGSYPWQTASGYRGLTTLFWSREDGRFLSSTLTRPVATAPGFDPVAAYSSAPVWPGLASASRAAGAEIDLARARRNPNGRLSGGDDTLAQHEPASSAELFAALSPIRRWADLSHAGEPVGLLEPRDELGDWVVLAPTAAREPRFDEVRQRVEWPLIDSVGADVVVRLRYSEYTANAVARLRAVAWQPELLVVGRVDRSEEGLALMPLSLIRPHLSCADSPVDCLYFDKPHSRTRSTAAATPRVGAVAPAPTPIEGFLAWLQRIVERGIAPSRAPGVAEELRRRHRELRVAGFTVFPADVDVEPAVQVLRSYAIAEQVRRLRDSWLEPREGD